MGRFAKFDPMSVKAAELPEKPLDPFRVIIPCGGQKVDHATLARHLYTGSYFTACLEFAKSIVRNERSILILSAKHGFIDLNELVEPYDVRFGEKGQASMDLLAEQARERGIDKLPVLALGGLRYVTNTAKVCPNCTALSDFMLDGTGIGLQIRWLKNNLGRAPAPFLETVKAGA